MPNCPEVLNKISEFVPYGAAIFGPDGELVYLSARVCSLLDLTPETAQCYGWWATLEQDDVETIKFRWNACLKTATRFTYALTYKDLAGQIHNVGVDILPMTSAINADLEGWSGYFRPMDMVIKDQVLADEWGIEAYRLDLASMKYDFGPNSPQQPSYAFLAGQVHPDDHNEFCKVLDAPDLFSVRYRVRSEAGRTVWYEDRGRIERGEDNEPVAIVGVRQNVTRWQML